jgi:hypothetical protein
VDEVHILVHAIKVKDGGGIGASIILMTDVADCLEESNAVLGGASGGPRVHPGHLCFHLWCGVLHQQVINFLGVITPPFLLIVCMFFFCHFVISARLAE